MDLNELGPLTERFNSGTGNKKNPVKREQYRHRQAAYKFAQGATVVEVAQALGVGKETVSTWHAQPWFQARVHQIQLELGMSDDVQKKLESEAMKSLQVLTDIRDSDKAPAAVKASVAMNILDRVLGKPTQTIKNEAVPHSDDPVAEAQRLRAENDRLAAYSNS